MDSKRLNIDELFEKARNEAPQISFAQSQEVFLASLGSGVGAGFSFWKQFINLKNGLIMLSTGTIIGITAFLLQPAPAETQLTEETTKTEIVAPEVAETIEAQPEEQAENLVITVEEEQKEEILVHQVKQVKQVKAKVSPSTQTRGPLLHMTMGSEAQEEKQVMMQISHETSAERMNEIKEMADRAGVDLKYKMGGKSNSLRSLSMKLKSAEEQSKSDFSFSSNFQLNIGWIENEQGQAIRLYNDISENVLKSLQEIPKEIERIPEIIEEVEDELNIISEELEIPEVPDEVPMIKEIEAELNKVIHVVNNLTTEEELMNIQKDANEAGIEFSYSGKFKRNGIKDLHIGLVLMKNGEKKKSNYHFRGGLKSNFSFNITWHEDEEGKAVDFAGNEKKPCNILSK